MVTLSPFLAVAGPVWFANIFISAVAFDELAVTLFTVVLLFTVVGALYVKAKAPATSNTIIINIKL